MAMERQTADNPTPAPRAGRHRLSALPGEVRFNFWTPLTPEEIAIELRPFLVGQAAPWDPGPRLFGTLGNHAMSLRWRHPRRSDMPQYLASYRPSGSGTVLDGSVVPPRSTRIELWVMVGLAVAQIIALTAYYTPLAANPGWRSILTSAATPTVITSAVVAVTISRVVASRRATHEFAPRYRDLLASVLMARDVGMAQ